MNHPFLIIFVKITIFSLMLAIGINFSFEKMLSLWRKPAILFRAILAVVVIVPLMVIILLKLFHLPPEVMTALAFLTASPGAPLSTKRSQMAGGKLPFSASLQLTLALLAVFVTPITLAIFRVLFDEISQTVTVLEVAKQVLEVQFLPITIGILLQKFGAKYASIMAKPLTSIANSLFFILVITACIAAVPILFKVSGLSLFFIAIMTIASLAIGHILGGIEGENRSSLAISCIARNVGLALFIAVIHNMEKEVISVLVAYVLIAGILGVIYSVWYKKRLGTEVDGIN